VIRRGDKHWAELDEMAAAANAAFLPDEQAETTQSALADLRARVNKLEQQVMALYTSMASYATIAERNTDLAKQEARADLDRSQSTVIGLIEKVRTDLGNRVPSGYSAVGGAAHGGNQTDRLLRLDERLDALATTMEHLAREQGELRAHLARLVEQQMSNDGWLVSNGPAETLSLH
jgi:cell division protein FtsB